MFGSMLGDGDLGDFFRGRDLMRRVIQTKETVTGGKEWGEIEGKESSKGVL